MWITPYVDFWYIVREWQGQFAEFCWTLKAFKIKGLNRAVDKCLGRDAVWSYESSLTPHITQMR